MHVSLGNWGIYYVYRFHLQQTKQMYDLIQPYNADDDCLTPLYEITVKT